MADTDAPDITAENGTADDVAGRVHDRPFGEFERYCPCGTPEQVAAALRPYVEAGCRSFNLIPVADSEQAAVEAVGAVRGLLREEQG
jgi:alkanesulfonate monooxygenase SsuD/methylene tetrahydromethanopterin reductase-like flavin-dependent oxidoreductase (luciferase family)